jgi:DNA-binding transcriptional LysR family regulator
MAVFSFNCGSAVKVSASIGTQLEVFDATTYFARDAVPVHTRLVVGSVEAACVAARAGIGITIAFAYQLQADPAAGALTTLLDDFQPAPRPLNLVYAANRFLPIKVRAFLDFVAPRLKRVLAESWPPDR